ncbi:MAG: DNA methyltransferase, partial [Cellvibrio sp.]
MSNSWIHLKQQDEAHALDSSLSKADSFGARDCGWVEQMRPFIRDFSSPGHVVLDPFSGFASTLVAASLEGRQSIGFEIEEKRFELSKKRLADLGCRDTRLFQGDCNELVSKLDP